MVGHTHRGAKEHEATDEIELEHGLAGLLRRFEAARYLESRHASKRAEDIDFFLDVVDLLDEVGRLQIGLLGHGHVAGRLGGEWEALASARCISRYIGRFSTGKGPWATILWTISRQ